MTKHEEKICPRCQSRFECKVGGINLCQCTTIQLNDKERSYIREQFEDCLCVTCLSELKKEYKQKQFEANVNQVYTLFNWKSPFANAK